MRLLNFFKKKGPKAEDYVGRMFVDLYENHMLMCISPPEEIEIHDGHKAYYVSCLDPQTGKVLEYRVTSLMKAY